MRSGAGAYGAIGTQCLITSDRIRLGWPDVQGSLPDARDPKRPRPWLTPALIDCHTPPCFRRRSRGESSNTEWGQLRGIARAGGGIRSTVVRRGSPQGCWSKSPVHASTPDGRGVCEIEVKSAHGLDLDTELPMLDSARTLGACAGRTVRAGTNVSGWGRLGMAGQEAGQMHSVE